uniref:Homeobox domain-containing protein n=1 Tax=Ananas comosus var. bracteatus TaxID=296719 RepID=A0A6V7NZZ2_ANACO|nr:unnamed protein product [Ananas comosus var. bracteatus]
MHVWLTDVAGAAAANNNNNNNNNVRELDMNQPASGGEEECCYYFPAIICAGEREAEAEEEEEEEDGGGSHHRPKKLRLSKEQSRLLEESFRQNHTLNPKQKEALAAKLKLRPRQVEVWFQNRRARTKLKQTEMECEYLKRCFGSLTEENRRLQREVEELRALRVAPPTVLSPHSRRPLPASSSPCAPVASASPPLPPPRPHSSPPRRHSAVPHLVFCSALPPAPALRGVLSCSLFREGALRVLGWSAEVAACSDDISISCDGGERGLLVLGWSAVVAAGSDDLSVCCGGGERGLLVLGWSAEVAAGSDDLSLCCGGCERGLLVLGSPVEVAAAPTFCLSAVMVARRGH